MAKKTEKTKMPSTIFVLKDEDGYLSVCGDLKFLRHGDVVGVYQLEGLRKTETKLVDGV